MEMADASNLWHQDAIDYRRRRGESYRGPKPCDAAEKRRNGGRLAESEVGGLYAEAEQRVREASMFGKLSNRRYRRWVNDRILRELAPPLDAVDIGELFAPPPWGAKEKLSPFERVTDSGARAADIAAWEPFANNVDMDWQAKRLQQLETCKKRTGIVSSREAAMLAWRKVEHQARDALKRSSSSPLLLEFEEKLLAYLQEVENGKISEDLILAVDAPYHRLLLHGLSQFHGLVTQSVDSIEATGMMRSVSAAKKMHIRKIRNCKEESARSSGAPLSLYQFLQGLQQCQTVATA